MPIKLKQSSKFDDDARSKDTRTRLIDAAMEEFNEGGYFNTDTNRIAHRAGFAPQTFYRWFKDKTEVFVAAYQVWEEAEGRLLAELVERKAATKLLVRSVVSHHREFLNFRRSLRQLAVSDATIRQARAASRARQIGKIKKWQHSGKSNDGTIAAMLLQMERLADALAEKELEDMSLTPDAAEGALAGLIEALRK